MSESTFYSLKAELPGGKTYDFADLKGNTVLIVNTASNWYVLPLNLIPKRELPD
jgi:glutathione peroxidase-family protein